MQKRKKKNVTQFMFANTYKDVKSSTLIFFVTFLVTPNDSMFLYNFKLLSKEHCKDYLYLCRIICTYTAIHRRFVLIYQTL